MFRKKPQYFAKKNLTSYLMMPLSWIYMIFFLSYSIKLMPKKKICKKTICIGNIVCGGSGKTPVCIAICKYLSKLNQKVCFVTKGYGRTNKINLTVPKNHDSFYTDSEIGDEAKLLCKYADTFLVNHRKDAESCHYDVAIMDDGFFSKSLHKDCNIAVFGAKYFIGNGLVLPSGPLRYKLTSLHNSDFAIITNADDISFARCIEVLSDYIDKNRILQAKTMITSKHSKKDRYFAFSGIGHNNNFLNSLKKLKLNIVGTLSLEDHQKYTIKIIKKIQNQIIKSDAKRVITTHKDFVKLPQWFIKKFNVEILQIEFEIKDIEKIANFLKIKKEK